jgi:preprotein translocase subunit SecD
MMICWERFNIYLVLGLAATLACGCQTSAERKASRQISSLRLHLQASRDGTKGSEPVPIYREKPVWVNVEKEPFLTEHRVLEAQVVDVVGGFALRIQYDGRGTTMLEEYTTAHRGRKVAVFSQFGPESKDARWLAAPRISRRITDGVFIFTPDATREEAEEIALGLNNVSKHVHTWVDK